MEVNRGCLLQKQNCSSVRTVKGSCLSRRAETARGSGVCRAEKGTFGVADSVCRSVRYPLNIVNTKGGNDLPPEAFTS